MLLLGLASAPRVSNTNKSARSLSDPAANLLLVVAREHNLIGTWPRTKVLLREFQGSRCLQPDAAETDAAHHTELPSPPIGNSCKWAAILCASGRLLRTICTVLPSVRRRCTNGSCLTSFALARSPTGRLHCDLLCITG